MEIRFISSGCFSYKFLEFAYWYDFHIILTPLLGNYPVTKHAIVALSEALHIELVQEDSKIKVHVLFPGIADTPFQQNINLPEITYVSGEVLFQSTFVVTFVVL